MCIIFASIFITNIRKKMVKGSNNKTKRKKHLTLNEAVAKKFEIKNEAYVGQIKRGERVPIRGKGLKVKNYLEEIFGEL